MGKVIATYLVKVTLREVDGLGEDGQASPTPPTNEGMIDLIGEALDEALAQVTHNVTSERTDK